LYKLKAQNEIIMNTCVTSHQFDKLQDVYTYYNNTLFLGTLPNCFLNFSRLSKSMGFFVAVKWKDRLDGKYHEISINPDYIDEINVKELHQTIVHEMCHLWQEDFGAKSRNGYHNKEWAKKMIEVGLMPSSTGQAGGKTTGQNMNDYPIEGGLFELHFGLIETLGYRLELPLVPVNFKSASFIVNSEGEADETGEEEKETSSSKKGKHKYSCDCGCNVWGKEGLDLQCNVCNSNFQME
jgi:predicted SprT family Zn-dependent metalloprotease